MIRIAAALLLSWTALSTGAAFGQAPPPCPKKPSALALRFTGQAPESDVLRLLDKAGKPFDFGKSPDVAFEKRPTWIHSRGGPTIIEQFAGLKLGGGCFPVVLVGPKLARLEDGVCYGVFEGRMTPACWTLKVSSTPFGHPFEWKVGTKSAELRECDESDESSRCDPKWNFVADLPRAQVANVNILAIGSKKPLLSLKVSYARVSSQATGWKPTEKELKASVVLPAAYPGTLQDDALLARKALHWDSDEELRSLALELLAVESPP